MCTEVVWADVVSYPRHPEVTPSQWHTALPQAIRELPQGPNPIGTLVPHHRWFGKQNMENVSVPLRTTYLIPSPLVIKPCWKWATAIGTHALTAKQLPSIQMRKANNSAAQAPFSCHDYGHGSSACLNSQNNHPPHGTPSFMAFPTYKLGCDRCCIPMVSM